MSAAAAVRCWWHWSELNWSRQPINNAWNVMTTPDAIPIRWIHLPFIPSVAEVIWFTKKSPPMDSELCLWRATCDVPRVSVDALLKIRFDSFVHSHKWIDKLLKLCTLQSSSVQITMCASNKSEISAHNHRGCKLYQNRSEKDEQTKSYGEMPKTHRQK